MARKQNRILPMEGTPPSGRLRIRIVVWVLVLLSILVVVAYIDGGEEPLRPISEPVELPEGTQ
ncbi:hypothetical protein ACRAQ6_09160 [Erythrobacter sp. HA6-11]